MWFCTGDNLCAMFFCQDNNIFSADACGCIPPHRHEDLNHLHSLHHDGSGSSVVGGDNKVGGGGVGVSMATVIAPPTTTPASVLAGNGRVHTSPSAARKPESNCPKEIQIDGVSARTPGIGGSEVYVEARGVIDVGNGSAYYDGYSYLAIPLYNNARFDAGITVDFVLEEGTSTLRQVLMTNCKHGQGASVEVVLDVDLGVIVFHVLYRLKEAVNLVESILEVAVPYTAFAPKRVAMVFDGHTLTGRVNGNERSANVRGNGDFVMAQRPKPLLFGNTLCDVDDIYSFRGQMKQISMYRCAKPMAELFS
ncbi:hypothetical protein V1264_021441 [Littorina saxatilis]|uniref:Uncharacterized protein n=1 Tax=Littorina saxatilis TaxID=31220 RepID=A0AAN9AIB4_9CAEN